jgi:hypothetical protein
VLENIYLVWHSHFGFLLCRGSIFLKTIWKVCEWWYWKKFVAMKVWVMQRCCWCQRGAQTHLRFIGKLFGGFGKIIVHYNSHKCHNPNLGLTTKAKACKGASQEQSPKATFHAPGSVGKCEGMNPHTPN